MLDVAMGRRMSRRVEVNSCVEVRLNVPLGLRFCGSTLTAMLFSLLALEEQARSDG